MNVKPLADRILVKNESAENKTASGLFIPENSQEKTQIADVIEVGTDKEICVKPGDKIMYEKFAGTKIKVDGAEHLILKMSNVIAIVEK